ncbi:hypothetical protein JY96_15505 [Aquabacterium sp. NJ1]|uniref:DUF1800 domain-containing protein n=1 Tax=Aquabacterium sp. NJ1 TaxID=1538295 RepID=UPI00052B811C|nr:DUF1800 domain-containing protein [Aquabacterium sp. NJ1]KGM40977.1 hypothetical protein JY96_15505 [Aquabacterium sp. NJ1]
MRRILIIGLLGLSLAACGGGRDASASGSSETAAGNSTPSQWMMVAGVPSTVTPGSRQEAARFLTQATFGPTEADIDHLMAIGYEAWLKEQFEAPAPTLSHQAYWEMRNTALNKANPGHGAGADELVHSFWAHALAGPDQLRQRLAFALSEIFVVSWADSCGADNPRGVASYLDMLGRQAFGSYRSLLESVTLHPVMGCYLSHLRNQKEDPTTGRVPDENFAREIMQLFSIGLYELQPDGSFKLGSNGQPIETYSADDIAGLAKVFTGWSWDCPNWPSEGCFLWGEGRSDGSATGRQFVNNMRPYSRYHSSSEKRFLGVTIEASTFFPSPESDLNVALNTLARHPNVGPFIGRQLIQRLVTSNPSKAYVQRVAAAFNQSGGSMREMVRAVLLDPEARNTAAALSSTTFGKVREPILKLSAVLRGVGVHSDTGYYLVSPTQEPATALNQAPMRSPSVFNFFRPGFVPSNSATAHAGLVAPEMQLVHETSVAGYATFMSNIMFAGLGAYGFGNGTRGDVQFNFNLDPNDAWLKLSDQPTALVNQLSERLMYGAMPDALKAEIVKAVSAVDFRVPGATTAEQIRSTALTRVRGAVLLTAVSPEFQVQK